MATTQQLLDRISTLVSEWETFRTELIEWLTGSKAGGPNGDGKFPLTTRNGDTKYVMSPAKVADLVSGPAAKAETEAGNAAGSANTAATEALAAGEAKVQARSARDAAEGARDRAEIAEGAAINSENNARSLVRKHFPASNQLVLPGKTTVSNMRDGSLGAMGWDNDNLYLKTENGVKRIPLQDL